MEKMESLILKVLSSSDPIRAKEIASEIKNKYGVETSKNEVNSILYSLLKGKVVQDGEYRWKLVKKGDSPVIKNTNGASAIEDNSELSRLSNYFLECLSRDRTDDVSFFAFNKFGKPDYEELAFLPNESTIGEITHLEGVQRLLAKIRNEKSKRLTLSLGYPVKARQVSTGYVLEPIFIIPIEFEEGNFNKSLRLDDELPILNASSLKGLEDSTDASLLKAAAQLNDELGLNSNNGHLPDFDELILRFAEIRRNYPWVSPLDPYKLDQINNLQNTQRSGIYNKVVIFCSERSPYTRGLENELYKLAKLPEKRIHGTALSNWMFQRTGGFKQEVGEILEVIPLNEEQREAVKAGLSEPLSVITGPPGTGKSQVVTSLLVNAAWKGQKVLFASKNNKAVDVVEIRVNSLGPRPVLLRLGSNDLQKKLADYLDGLLAATSTESDEIRYTELKSIKEGLKSKIGKINQELDKIVSLRNLTDQKEKGIEEIRATFTEEEWREVSKLNSKYLEQALLYFGQLKRSLQRLDKKNHDFFTGLFWFTNSKKFFAQANVALNSFLKESSKVPFNWEIGVITEDNLEVVNLKVIDFQRRIDDIQVVSEYFQVLENLKHSPTQFELSKELFGFQEQLQSVSNELWNYWIKLQPSRLTLEERRIIGEYVTLLKTILNSADKNENLDKSIWHRYYETLPKVGNILPCWAVTSLSVSSKVPFEAGFFDLVIVDEASQCDIASVLPLLYRAKRAIIIGDKKQLSHISSISQEVDTYLLEKYKLDKDFLNWKYSVNSLFDLASILTDRVIGLKDHHRSHSEIIDFSNKYFYGDSLRVATKYDKLRTVKDGGPVVRWIDVRGKAERPRIGSAINKEEAMAVRSEILRLLKANYQGTIGVVSPFSAQATQIRDILLSDEYVANRIGLHDILVDTVHKFQGDERDVMIFSPTLSPEMHRGGTYFLSQNGNLFNVAITRARSCLIVVGDKNACLTGGVPYLKSFAEYVDQLSVIREKEQTKKQDYGPVYPAMNFGVMVSDWEKKLYQALYSRGIKAIPQYTVEKYRLDLALLVNGKKLDIEVDGELYHRNWDGELNRRDQLRNKRMIELGWEVKRFWVYQIRDDLGWCVGQVEKWLDDARTGSS